MCGCEKFSRYQQNFIMQDHRAALALDEGLNKK